MAQFFFVHTAEADLDGHRTRRQYEFLHATFGEYLVAREVVETLIDTAHSTVGRRGERAPDDDRLFALLSHDCLAVRSPILDFIADLLAGLPLEDRERITPTIVALLANARRRRGSTRYVDYRPTETDHLRAITAYTANLVLLAILVDREKGFPVANLPRDVWTWDLLLDLWRAGLNTDSWYSLLGMFDRKQGVLHLSGELPSVAGLSSDIRYAELIQNHALALTLRIGRAIREVFEARFSATFGDISTAEHEELLGQLIAVLAFRRGSRELPMREERLAELLAETNQHDYLDEVICMVLKQRAAVLPEKIVCVLVAYLLDQDCLDTYAFIAAMGAHPDLIEVFPQLLDPNRYVGMYGTELMLRGTIESTGAVRLRPLLDALPPTENLSKAAEALLDAFQWRIEP